MDRGDLQDNQRQATERVLHSMERSPSPMSTSSLNESDNFSDSSNLSDLEWATAMFERNYTVISAASTVLSYLYGPSLATGFFHLFFSSVLVPLANSMNDIVGSCPRYEDALERYVSNSMLHNVPVRTYNRMLVEGARLFNSLFSRFRLVIDDPNNPPPYFRYEMPDSSPPPFLMARLERVLEKH
ncbi:hypothetical protein F5Y09DRAFT_355590 [Xylaria sp. FL1042]|nr:hypothetical protein F5Y09DRAFT_355590 [Xylaria sp. FL1042]